MELKGFYESELLDEWLNEGEIDALEYINHHSEDLKEDFTAYCQEHDLPIDKDAAAEFIDSLL